MNTNNQTSTKGFTLVEVLVATALTMIVMGFVIGLQYVLANARRVTINNYYSVDTTNVALNTITREIRTARLSEMGTYPIESATTDQLVFYSDIDFDNRIERVRYTRSGTTLEKGVVEPTGAPVSYPQANESVKTISDSINQTTPLFTYYNGDWPADTVTNPLSSPPSLSEIKLIKISLEVETNNEPYILESLTTLRMLKDNL